MPCRRQIFRRKKCFRGLSGSNIARTTMEARRTLPDCPLRGVYHLTLLELSRYSFLSSLLRCSSSSAVVPIVLMIADCCSIAAATSVVLPLTSWML